MLLGFFSLARFFFVLMKRGRNGFSGYTSALLRPSLAPYNPMRFSVLELLWATIDLLLLDGWQLLCGEENKNWVRIESIGCYKECKLTMTRFLPSSVPRWPPLVVSPMTGDCTIYSWRVIPRKCERCFGQVNGTVKGIRSPQVAYFENAIIKFSFLSFKLLCWIC